MDKVWIINLNREDVDEFCKCCDSFKSDIDLIDGSNILDAKDFSHVVLMCFEKNFCVSINSDNNAEILEFNKAMEKYQIK